MNFTELLDECYTLTNRPDLIAETKLAVKAATLKAHQSDFFSKDIYETIITAEFPGYNHSIDYVSIISNLRALKYIRKIDSEGKPAEFVTIITPEQVLDSYNTVKTDVAYIAGRSLELNSSTEIQKLIIGCYVNPLVTEGEYSSWVADLYPYVIVYEAVRTIFKQIGYDEQAAQYNALAAEQFILLRNNALPDVGA